MTRFEHNFYFKEKANRSVCSLNVLKTNYIISEKQRSFFALLCTLFLHKLSARNIYQFHLTVLLCQEEPFLYRKNQNKLKNNQQKNQ